MPVTLLVKSKPGDAELAPLTFDVPRILLGRGNQCDVRLPDASVSARHCSIRAANAGYVVVDEGSTNGTRLGGDKLASQAPRAIKNGDILQLGRVTIEVRIGAAVASSANATRELALALVARRLGDPSATQVQVRVVEGPDAGASVPLGALVKKIGRDPRCELKLTDRGVPPFAIDAWMDASQAKVIRRDERVPVTLADKPLDVGAPIVWNDRRKLVVASTTLELDDPLARALDASAQGDDEKVVVAPEPEPPPTPPPAMEVAEAQKPADPDRVVIRPPTYDRRRSWRGATIAFELVALILGLLVLGGSAAGLWWLLRK